MFFKQTTAYELRISDWSSDVCSSDLYAAEFFRFLGIPAEKFSCICHFRAGIGEALAIFQRDYPGQALTIADHQIIGLAKDFPTSSPRHGSPFGKGTRARIDRLPAIHHGRARERCHKLYRRWLLGSKNKR